MSVRIVDVFEVTKPISSPIRNAYIDFTKMTTSLVAVVTDVKRDGRRVVGYGFNSNGRYGQGGLIRERVRDRILEAEPKSLLNEAGDKPEPPQIWAAMMTNEKPGGHGERSVAVGTLDMAIWDATAKIAGQPLFRLLAERSGREANRQVFVYAAGGYYYPGKDDSALRTEMRGYLDRGYRVVKMKIGGAPIAEDRRRIEAVLAEIGKDAQLAVDANGRFDLETAIAYAKMLREYPLFWYEEAGDPLDYALQAALAEFYPGPMATGENLFSHQDARNLLRYGGMRPDRDLLQFDCALSYGLVEYLRTLDVLAQCGWSPARCIPHGGHQMSLNIAAGLGLGGNESYPDLFQPYGGFPDSVRGEGSYITMPELPGIGFEGKSDLIRGMRELGGEGGCHPGRAKRDPGSIAAGASVWLRPASSVDRMVVMDPGFAAARRPGMTTSALLDVPERNDLRDRQHATQVLAIGDRRGPLAEPDMRHEVPIVLLHLACDRFLLIDTRGRGPFVAQLLVHLVGRPAEPALLAVRLMADERDRIADRGRTRPGDEQVPAALVRRRLHGAARDHAAPVGGRELHVDADIAQALRHDLCGVVHEVDVGRVQQHDRLAVVAGFCDQLLRFRGVRRFLEPLRVLVVLHRRAAREVGGTFLVVVRVAERCLHELFLVDQVEQRFARIDVVERRIEVIDPHNPEVAGLVQDLDLDGGIMRINHLY